MTIELACDKPRGRLAVHVVPPIPSEWGSSWIQPKLTQILIGDKQAFMSRASFQKLREYSTTTPSGVYPGKMWRCNLYDDARATWTDVWQLRWFGVVPGNPKVCSNHTRVIVILGDKA